MTILLFYRTILLFHAINKMQKQVHLGEMVIGMGVVGIGRGGTASPHFLKQKLYLTLFFTLGIHF